MKRLLHLLLIIPMLWLFHNRVANWHFHALPNGIVVEHAHPYEKKSFPNENPAENHHHSDIEFLILDLVFRAALFVLACFILCRVFKTFLQFLPVRKYILVPNPAITGLPLLRAPPVS